LAGIVEATLSLWYGHAEISMSLYGIALMAIVDITGSVLVLAMWQSSYNKERLISDRLREMNYSIAIGSMMIMLGIFLIVDSTIKLTNRNIPEDSSFMGTLDAVFGFVCGISLFLYKYYVGKALDSPVVVADSISSLCSGLTSFAALLVVILDQRLWWSDSTAGFTAALYTLYSGTDTIISSRHEIYRLRDEKAFLARQAAHNSIKKIMSNRSVLENGSDDSRDMSRKRDTRRSLVKKFYESFSFFSSPANQDYDKLPLTESEDQDDEIIFNA